jgi:hypothetical protein
MPSSQSPLNGHLCTYLHCFGRGNITWGGGGVGAISPVQEGADHTYMNRSPTSVVMHERDFFRGEFLFYKSECILMRLLKGQ